MKRLTGQHDRGKLGHRCEGDYEDPNENYKVHDDVRYLTEKARQGQKRYGVIADKNSDAGSAQEMECDARTKMSR